MGVRLFSFSSILFLFFNKLKSGVVVLLDLRGDASHINCYSWVARRVLRLRRAWAAVTLSQADLQFAAAAGGRTAFGRTLFAPAAAATSAAAATTGPRLALAASTLRTAVGTPANLRRRGTETRGTAWARL